MFSQIALLFSINVLSAIGYSLLAPLYPTVAKSKGVEEYQIGIIFSFFAISNIIAIPLTPKLIGIYGRRKLFYIAMIIEVNKQRNYLFRRLAQYYSVLFIMSKINIYLYY